MKRLQLGIMVLSVSTLLHIHIKKNHIPSMDVSKVGLTFSTIDKPTKIHIDIDTIQGELKKQEIKYKKEQEEIKRKAELERLEKLKIEEENNRRQNSKEVTCLITYYYADTNTLQGGLNDKRGIPLDNYNQPVCALPSNIPYGSRLILDEPIVYDTSLNTSTEFTNVDTGGAITWINDNTCKVDIFVSGCSDLSWIESNLQNKTVKGRIVK